MEKKHIFIRDLTAILVRQKAIEEKEAEALIKLFADRSSDTVDNFLLDEGLIEKIQLLRALSTYYKAPYVDVVGYIFNPLLVREFPKDFLLRNSIVPMEVDDEILIVIASDPEAVGLESSIREYVSYGVEFMVGLSRDIEDEVKEYYDKSPTEEPDDLDVMVEHRHERQAAKEPFREDVEEMGYQDGTEEEQEWENEGFSILDEDEEPKP
jgi:hypothetical protein